MRETSAASNLKVNNEKEREMNWKIGDKVRLSGWDSEHHWGVRPGWEIELVERKDSVMSVDFSDVNVGDKVRLTRENGDETTFTVAKTMPREGWATSEFNMFREGDWNTLEIVERVFKPVPGLYSNPRTGDRVVVQRNLEAYYAAAGGRWIQANVGSGNVDLAVRGEHGWKREITF